MGEAMSILFSKVMESLSEVIDMTEDGTLNDRSEEFIKGVEFVLDYVNESLGEIFHENSD